MQVMALLFNGKFIGNECGDFWPFSNFLQLFFKVLSRERHVVMTQKTINSLSIFLPIFHKMIYFGVCQKSYFNSIVAN